MKTVMTEVEGFQDLKDQMEKREIQVMMAKTELMDLTEEMA